MPLMIPEDIEQFTTAGEEAFYRYLRAFAKPDDQFVIWYAPDVSDTEPDFILYSPDVGLIVFEVKDWVINVNYFLRSATIKIPVSYCLIRDLTYRQWLPNTREMLPIRFSTDYRLGAAA